MENAFLHSTTYGLWELFSGRAVDSCRENGWPWSQSFQGFKHPFLKGVFGLSSVTCDWDNPQPRGWRRREIVARMCWGVPRLAHILSDLGNEEGQQVFGSSFVLSTCLGAGGFLCWVYKESCGCFWLLTVWARKENGQQTTCGGGVYWGWWRFSWVQWGPERDKSGCFWEEFEQHPSGPIE